MTIAEALKLNSTLTSLYLQKNSLWENSGLAIAEALKFNSTLTTLELSRNSLGMNSGLAIAEALKFNSTLTSLDLRWNLFGQNGGMAIAQALKSNGSLTSLYVDLQEPQDGVRQDFERNKSNQLLRTCTLFGLILPMLRSSLNDF